MHFSEKKEKGRKNGFQKAALFWFSFFTLLLVFGFIRYFYSSFVSNPSLQLNEEQESPFEVSRGGSFVLEFDQRMQKKSVENALSIQPEIGYSTQWDGRKLFLIPEKTLEEDVVYYVSLNRGPKNILGKALQKTYLLKYQLGEDPHLLRLYPNANTIDPHEKIILMFSHPMVGEALVENETNPDFLSLTPAVEGSWMWRNTKVLVFTPKNGFPLSTRFQVKNTNPLYTYDNAPIKEEVDGTFETPRLAYIDKLPETENVIRILDEIVLHFNQPVDFKSLERNLEIINSSGKKIEKLAISLEHDESGYKYKIRTTQNWPYSEEYDVNVSSGLMPEKGNLGLESDMKRKVRTEDFLAKNTFRLSKNAEILKANDIIRISLKEPLPVEVLKNSIRLFPEKTFEIKKEEGMDFLIKVNEVSQKGEHLKLMILPSVNSEERTLLTRIVEYPVKNVDHLKIFSAEKNESICITSNYPLTAKSYLSEGIQRWKLENDLQEICEGASDFTYFVPKKVLEPGKKPYVKVSAEDIFDQKAELQVQTTTNPLRNEDVSILSQYSNFYTAIKKTDNLVFKYSTMNVSKVNVQVCKLSSELAISIEGTYEEKWNSFFPGPEKCLKFKSYFQDIIPEWGREQMGSINIHEVFDDVTPGLYYVNVSSPSFFDLDGRSVQTNGILNYTPWNIFSKKGDSALVWITEGKKTVPNTSVRLYASDGSLLEAGKTDQNGIFFREKNRLKYEFVVAKKGDQEALLNVFYQEGFEPGKFSVMSNPDESPYLYQFYLEELSRNSRSMNGVFILKEKDGSQPKPPKVSGATVTLYDSEEQLLWRRYETMDEYGNLYFQIYPPHTLLDGKYFLGVCLGLHEGVCHGTFLWTTLFKGVIDEGRELSKMEPSGKNEVRHIDLKEDKEWKPGEEVSIQIRNIRPNIPLLITLERDRIYWKKVLNPKADHEEVKIKITDDMTPEVIMTVFQPDEESPVYDMKHLDITREQRKLGYSKNEKTDQWKVQGSKTAEPVSQILFDLDSESGLKEEVLFNAFYPRQGTSIITSTTGKIIAKENIVNTIAVNAIPDLIFVDGKLLREPYTMTDEKSYFMVAHDTYGNFGSVILSGTREEKKISLESNAPSFLRMGDQAIFSFSLRNNYEENKYLQFNSHSEVLDFLNGESVFLGLAGNQEKTLELATNMKELTNADVVTAHFDVLEDERKEAGVNISIPVRSPRYRAVPQNIMVYENPLGKGTIKMPNLGFGQWENSLIISTSPLSYVLENLKTSLQKESLGFDEVILMRTIEANYSDLMKEAFDDTEMLEGIVEKRNTIENLLYYLEERQKNDGGWSYFPEDEKSDPILSSWISKSVAGLEQIRVEVSQGIRKKAIGYLKEQLDNRVNQRIRQGTSVADVPEDQMFFELQILNALSSFTPAGISYANNWYTAAEKLPNHSLVLLLLTLEDYRDAGVTGMNYKIEELIQILKSRQENFQQQSWIRSDHSQKIATDFLVTSWYLEALIRQASARKDIPAVINWLVKNKYLQINQSSKDQFSYLQAMASYLRIYQEEIKAEELRVVFGNHLNKKFTIHPGKPFQSIFINRQVTSGEDLEMEEYLDISTDKDQPLFIELNWKKKETSEQAVSNGISLYQSFPSKDLKKGDRINGVISIIVPDSMKNVVVMHPITSAARDISQRESSLWKVKTLGKDEKWYLFPELPEGETVIPFEWEITQAGVFTVPQIQAYAIDQPKTLSSSNVVKMEVRNE